MSHRNGQGRTSRAIRNSIAAVIDQLETRRFLSADAGVLDEEVLCDDTAVVEDLAVTDDGGSDEELIYTTLMVEDTGEVVDDGEVLDDGEDPVFKGDGEDVTEPVLDENGEVIVPVRAGGVGGDDVTDGEVKITMAGEDGEPVENLEDGGNPDINGDGVVDELDTVVYMTGVPTTTPTRLKSNGTLLINGTGGNDNINISRNANKIIVDINGATTEFDSSLVDLIKVAAGAGNDGVTNDTNVRSRIQGERGNDSLAGGDANDRLLGGKGDDNLNGGAGDDRLVGHRGNDNLTGGDGADDLSGGRGEDNLLGGLGNDQVRGGRGRDEVDAGDGNDFINGGGGLDRITAGPGTDQEQDPSDSVIDHDAADDLSANLRLAAPGWWQEVSDTGDQAMNIVIDNGDGNDIVGGDDSGDDILM